MYFVIIIPYNDIITIRRTLDLFVRKTFTIMKIHKQHFTLICSVLIAMLLFLMFDSETAKAEVDLTVLPEVKEESESFSELQVDEDITATIFEEETVINPTEESSEVLPENLSSEDDIANSFPEMNENLIEPVPEESQDFPVEDFVIEPEIDSEETPAEIVEPSLEPDSSEEILMEELPAEPSDQLIEKEDIEADLEQEVKDTDLELTKEEPNYEIRPIGNNLYFVNTETGEVRKDNAWIDYKDSRIFPNKEGILYRNQLITFGPSSAFYMDNDGFMTKDKIVEYRNNLYYMDKTTGNKRMDNKWIDLDDYHIFPNAEGLLYRNQFITFGPEKIHYMGSDGKATKGLKRVGNDLHYFDESTNEPLKRGIMRKDNKWVKPSGSTESVFVNDKGVVYTNQLLTFGPEITYYMGNDGYKVKGKIVEYGNNLYYMDKTTGNKRMDNKWIDLDDYHIFPNAEGLLYRNQFITFGPEKIHYMGSDGKATKGLKRVGNDLHYFDESTIEPLRRGVMRKDNNWVTPNGSKESVFVNDKGVVYTNQLLTFGPEISYYMGNDGYKVKGKIVEYGNNLYYMDETTGNKRMDNKWIDLNGNKIYPNAEGILYRNQFITFGPEVAYYMNNSGYLDKGNSDGIIQIKLEPLVYSVTKVNREDGKLIRQPGWIEYNGKKYFMNNFGMPYRNQFITFGPNIAYYMSNNGSAIINKSITLNNIPYSFDKNGILTTSYSGFEIINSYLYYFNNMINPIKGWYTVSNHGRIYGDLDTGRILYKNSIRMINGKEYLFNNNGSCTPTNSGYSYSTKLLTPWVSQLTPIYAPNGCELASALSGMRYQGYATNVSINRLISEMSRSSNPYYGFTTDPYQHSLGTIYPSALLPLIKKYAPNSYDMSRSTVDQWRNALDEGTPIVLWCTANFRAPNYCGLGYPCNTHVQLITGYSKMNNTFSIMDPYTWTAKSAHRIVNSTQLLNSNNYGGRFAIGIK